MPTQYLSEKLKTEGYDGVAYRSSLSQEGYNIVLFDPQKAKCVGCRMYEIKQVKYDFQESDNAISLSADDKVLYPRIKYVEPANADNGGKKDAENGKSHNKANSSDAKSRAAD